MFEALCIKCHPTPHRDDLVKLGRGICDRCDHVGTVIASVTRRPNK